MIEDNRSYKFLVSTIGDPESASTYSGVPYQLFKAMDSYSLIVKRINGYKIQPVDYLTGYYDIKKSLSKKKPYRNALWRYRQRTISKLSNRIDNIISGTEFDIFLQIGCGGLPTSGSIKIAHIEIPISMAMSDTTYATSYGFYDIPEAVIDDASKGEKRFIDGCDLIWTNTEWTADGLRKLGVPDEKLFIFPPCINLTPGRTYRQRELTCPKILFIGKDWERKGGPQLVDALRLLLTSFPDATLDIIGCTPNIDHPSVKVHGFIDKGSRAGFEKLKQITESCNIFCMPSQWESTGIVYFEAMENSLPVVMVKGQGREDLFQGICTVLDNPAPDTIAYGIENLIHNASITHATALKAYQAVTDKYNYEKLLEKLIERIDIIRSKK